MGHDVHAVLTRSGAEFITPLTLQTLTRNPVTLATLEDEKQTWKPGHIELADRAEILVVAPATANVIANFAHGLAPDTLTSVYLALPRSTPVLIAPAMNGKMWQHPATRRNVATLAADGCRFVGPDTGDLACGYEGVGRMASVGDIMIEIGRILAALSP
jgi:phosphopantothenoylcysteine decarboxylase/phosphopantothenoylcysteine decarboxylase/phosphopantothenate--cysteine ligase